MSALFTKTSMNSPQPATLHCYHCQLVVAPKDHFSCQLAGQERWFCCPACMAVAKTIHAGGMGSFYDFQENNPQRPSFDLNDEKFSTFDNIEFQQTFVTTNSANDGTKTQSCELLLGGVHCAACSWLIEKQLMQLDGMLRVSVNVAEQKATIAWQHEKLTLSTLCRSIAAIGYEPEPYQHDQLLQLQEREQRTALRRLGIAGIGMMQAGMFAIALYAGDLQSISDQYRDFMRLISLLVATVVVFFSAQSFFVNAWIGVKNAKPVMDLPVALAIGLAYGASIRATFTGTGHVYFDSVTMFTFLLLAGRYLEMRARHYSGRLNSNLHSLLPTVTTRLETIDGNHRQQSVPVFKLQIGDLVLVKTGQIIPADGSVYEGSSSINEAQLTGEFTPIHKTIGDKVIAGTINLTHPITFRVEATGKELQLEAINQLLNQAHQQKPLIAKLADQLSLYFVSTILVIAATTYLVWWQLDSERAFWITLSVLVVSCPCALSLATPTALTAASNRLRQAGIFVAAAQLWETVPKIQHIIFDKTGTLTRGEFSVYQTIILGNHSEEECLKLAATLENASEHPIAKAFSHYSQTIASQVEITMNRGLEGVIEGQHYRIGQYSFASEWLKEGAIKPEVPPQQDGQWILLSDQDQAIAWFNLKDKVRDDALSTINYLQHRGLTLHILSGDSSGSAQYLSDYLGIDHCIAGATPADKLAYIQVLQSQHQKVLMLGDGINDIPVLAAADVSIAMANAPDVAKTQADGILLSGHLGSLCDLMQLAGQTRKIIQQNLGWALLYNFLIIPLAVQGLIPPYLAAIGMSASSLLVLLNSLRIHHWHSVTDKIVQTTPIH